MLAENERDRGRNRQRESESENCEIILIDILCLFNESDFKGPNEIVRIAQPTFSALPHPSPSPCAALLVASA